MAAVFASNPGESVMEDAAIKVAVNYQFDIRTKKTIPFGKTVVVNLLKYLKMILNTLIINVLFLGAVHNLSQKTGGCGSRPA